MCHRNKLYFAALVAAGLGLILSLFLSGVILRLVVGIGLIVTGFFLVNNMI